MALGEEVVFSSIKKIGSRASGINILNAWAWDLLDR